MKLKACVRIVCVIMTLLLFPEVCMADEALGHQVYLQGSDSSVAEGEDGMIILTIENMVPYGVYLLDNSFIMPIGTIITDINGSLNAAVIQSGPGGETVSIVQVSNPHYSADSRVLTLEVQPLEFYEGTVLTNFMEEKQDFSTDMNGTILMTGVYLEYNPGAPDNICECECKPQCCQWCLIPGDPYGRCDPTCFSQCCDPDHNYY